MATTQSSVPADWEEAWAEIERRFGRGAYGWDYYAACGGVLSTADPDMQRAAARIVDEIVRHRSHEQQAERDAKISQAARERWREREAERKTR